MFDVDSYIRDRVVLVTHAMLSCMHFMCSCKYPRVLIPCPGPCTPWPLCDPIRRPCVSSLHARRCHASWRSNTSASSDCVYSLYILGPVPRRHPPITLYTLAAQLGQAGGGQDGKVNKVGGAIAQAVLLARRQSAAAGGRSTLLEALVRQVVDFYLVSSRTSGKSFSSRVSDEGGEETYGLGDQCAGSRQPGSRGARACPCQTGC